MCLYPRLYGSQIRQILTIRPARFVNTSPTRYFICVRSFISLVCVFTRKTCTTFELFSRSIYWQHGYLPGIHCPCYNNHNNDSHTSSLDCHNVCSDGQCLWCCIHCSSCLTHCGDLQEKECVSIIIYGLYRLYIYIYIYIYKLFGDLYETER